MIDVVHDTLLPWCSFLDWEPDPSIVTVANVQHLGTRIEGRLSSPPPNVLELVAGAVARRPALGGHPRDEALALIAAVEGVERGPLRRRRRLGRRRRQRHVGRRHPLRRAVRRRLPGPPASPAAASSPTATRCRARRDPGQVPGDALGPHPPLTSIRVFVRRSARREAAANLGSEPSRAAATAALSAAWTRDVLGPVGGDAGDRRAGRGDAVDELDGRRHGRGVEAVGPGEGDDVGAVRRAEQLLEPLRRQRRRLREEREDPAAVVVDDDDAQVGAPRRRAPSAPRRRGRRRCRRRGRPSAAPPSATPSAVDTTPSMPLAPRLAWARGRRAAEPLEVADRHRRRDDELGAGAGGDGRRSGRRPAR